jgi:hypothetical protein
MSKKNGKSKSKKNGNFRNKKNENSRNKQNGNFKSKQNGNSKNKKNGNSKATRANDRDISSELYEGYVRLEIESSEDFKQIDRFRKYLKAVENLRIASSNWSEEEGLMIIVSLRNPIPLGGILSQMPIVEQVYKKHNNIVTVLNGSAVGVPPAVGQVYS